MMLVVCVYLFNYFRMYIVSVHWLKWQWDISKKKDQLFSMCIKNSFVEKRAANDECVFCLHRYVLRFKVQDKLNPKNQLNEFC